MALALSGVAAAAALVPSASAAGSLPVDISSLRNTECILPSNVMLYGACAADAYRSYVAETVPAAGSVDVKGTTFSWPPNALRTNDVVNATGQTLTVPGNVKGYNSLAALIGGYNTDFVSTFSITYADGTKQALPFKVPAMNAKAGSDIKGVRAQYISDTYIDTVSHGEGAIGLAVMPINPKKVVKSITFPVPNKNGGMVIAVSFSPLTKAPTTGPKFH
jgi:hypothetical protein